MSKVAETLKVTYDELVNKVTWPSWEELKNSTIIVLIASIIFALAILAIDTAFGFVMEIIYDLVK